MFNEDRKFGFIKPQCGGEDVFFHESVVREGDAIAPGVAFNFELGTDPKTGRTKAIRVDLVG